MTVTSITLKTQQEQGEEMIRELQRRRCNWNIVWETKGREDVTGEWEITKDRSRRQEWEAISSMSRKRANVLLGSLYQGGDEHCVEMMWEDSSQCTDRTYVAC